jgi:MinD-like ATPase involved in chromosome partitioning or flagellar assembly
VPQTRRDAYAGTVVDGRRPYAHLPARLATRLSRLTVRRNDRDEAALEARLRTAGNLTRANVVAVASPKGGVGKTTCAFLIGATLAARRGLRVIAIDADHDVGTLGLLGPDSDSAATARDALRDLDSLESAAELMPYLSVHPSGLHILGGPAGSASRPEELAPAFGTLVALLERFYDLVLLDLGTGFANPVARFALKRADQTIMVTAVDRVTTTRVAAVVGRLLDPDGPARLRPDRFAVVINRVPRGRDAADRVAAVAAYFRELGSSSLVALPEDAQLAAMLDSGTYGLEPLEREMRMAIRQLALVSAQRLV